VEKASVPTFFSSCGKSLRPHFFIGDPLWVEEKYKELKELRKELREGKIEPGQDPPKSKKKKIS